ncbi:hypothetical protein Lesp01_40110 [Lentzea sp. NBRC 102530]|nr:hypothetical protein Lesp01_40110 [Lentzea sp. NBRC 102530]
MVRSDSCRATNAVSAAFRASTSRGPRSRRIDGVRYSKPPGSNSSRNHNRCCANDIGSPPSRGTTGISVSRTCADSATSAAIPATVGWRNNARGDISTSKAARSREITRMLRIESPPSAKKSSRTPMPGTPSTSDQMAATSRSVSVRGATCSVRASAKSGAGRARRSTLPLAFNGMASSSTNADGTR